MFLTKGYPISIYYQYNICNFTNTKDPIKRISTKLEELFNDDIRLLLDGSHVRYKESYIKDGYPAYALYHLERAERLHSPEDESPDNMHPDKKATKLKISIKKDAIPYLKKEILHQMKNKIFIIDISLKIVEDIFNNIIGFNFIEHMECFTVEFIIGNV